MTESTSRGILEAEVLENDGHPLGYREPSKLNSWGWRVLLGSVICVFLVLLFFGGWALFFDEPQWLDEFTDPIANLLAGNET